MSEPTITCPNCNQSIKLTDSLAAPLIAATRARFAAQLADKDREISTRLDAERRRIAAEEAEKAKRGVALDLAARDKQVAELNELIRLREKKLEEAQEAQAELMRKQRELDEAKRELKLSVEKQVQAGLDLVREKAKKDAEQALSLKLAEKEEHLASMQRKIEELQRKAEQGSQQLQGEVLELELEALLRQKFPTDTIEPVPKGEFGGDLVHHVIGPAGHRCGTLLWEAKRTRNWSDGWLAKLRGDQRLAKAEIAVIVSQALPKGLQSFDQIEGVWVVEPRCAVAVAIVLRQSLIEIAHTRQAAIGQQGKMELVYQYLTGPRFRHRIEAIVEKFTAMEEDLTRERLTAQKMWAKRESQIRGVLEATVGMYGDLQGIAGKSFQEIDALNIPLLDASD